VRVLGDLVGIDVDELDDPVGIGAAGGGEEMRDGLTADLDRMGERVGYE
jgi:hypothetical protein